MTSVLCLICIGSCGGDGQDRLEQACRVIIDDCHRGTSVGGCIDALGGESLECLSCIARSDCNFARECSQGSARCLLPDSYLDLTAAPLTDGGPEVDAETGADSGG